ncbi:MAG: pyruvoyl-dependent arginine decarboxylase [Candidatus Bilamarchaeaceae archaeon]
MSFVPKEVFFTNGVGKAKDQLSSFEMALRDAGISQFNLVTVSSILPPNCKIVPKADGLKKLAPGQIIFCVMARIASNEPNRLVSASVGSAIPADSNDYGYLSEHHAFGETGEKAGDFAEDLAAQMLASTLGVPFDSSAAWDEREQHFKMSGKIVKTKNITQSAVCDKDGNWTTAIAVAVFVQ